MLVFALRRREIRNASLAVREIFSFFLSLSTLPHLAGLKRFRHHLRVFAWFSLIKQFERSVHFQALHIFVHKTGPFFRLGGRCVLYDRTRQNKASSSYYAHTEQNQRENMKNHHVTGSLFVTLLAVSWDLFCLSLVVVVSYVIWNISTCCGCLSRLPVSGVLAAFFTLYYTTAHMGLNISFKWRHPYFLSWLIIVHRLSCTQEKKEISRKIFFPLSSSSSSSGVLLKTFICIHFYIAALNYLLRRPVESGKRKKKKKERNMQCSV